DATETERVSGVLKALAVDSGVAVVAETTWAAIEGRRALRVRWDEGPNAKQSSDQIMTALAQAAAPRSVPVPGAPEGRLDAVYTLTLQAHVPMEPLNCTADVRDGRCEVWAPTQDPQGARAAAQRASGLPTEQVVVHTTLMGGAFGRRSSGDFVEEAVRVAQAFGAPVQVVWTREDDIQHGRYQPSAHHFLSARLDAKGLPATWRHVIASEQAAGDIASGAQLRYAVGAQNTPVRAQSAGVPVGPWRSVAFYHNIFAVESFIDELAALGNSDPLELRRRLLARDAGMLAVLDLAAERAGWGGALPAGRGRGLAVCAYERTRAALVIEASVAPGGVVRVERAVCAIDCGVVVNPDGVEAQIEGAIAFGLTAALKGAITVAGGRVEQSNFHDYPLLRLPEMPRVEVAIVASDREPSGVGEPGVPLVGPALANALFAATGQRVRSLPVRLEA
ncbi:MAG TPA: molybdopterin cofactor-binding domain-containing protein, partial [Roseiflexaceae bacterium]|nr:molybdopterin cofactor-binding domain-containing protein [Roseiflexaceae bacterium]